MDRGTESQRPVAARLRGEQRGWTLVELLAVMGISLIVGAAALMAIETGQKSSAKTAARQEALQEAEVALARITKETRLATVIAVRSSTFLDLKTFVRLNGGNSQLRRVQYDCGDPAACRRRDCGPTSAGGSLVALVAVCAAPVATTQLVRGLDRVTFGAEQQGTALAVPPAREAAGTSPAFDYVSVALRVRLNDRTAGRQHAAGLSPIEIQGGVRLENVGIP